MFWPSIAVLATLIILGAVNVPALRGIGFKALRRAQTILLIAEGALLFGGLVARWKGLL